ncbi:hypothetical protein OG746_29300 [Streptomyces sp. NBC_01016]|uniref:hypothetical protein n=1 Tax=Streptomyces sp. NBC_01016 TaxID=2903720 RepID=UPI00225C378B|nr:hypothetical protein [Streptomyces sp. NBC_01016]MCX4832835.1 hypothetical protein [Streptomyces sp. NBC_01016]
MTETNPFNLPDFNSDAGIYADVTGVPPKKYLPKSLHKLVDDRDKAYDAFVDFESDHAELLQSNWRDMLRAQDEAAGRAAIVDGQDPLSVPSAMEDAETKRPRIIGALRALRDAAMTADRALVAAVRRELPAIAALVEPDVATAAEEYIKLQREADAARQRYGAKLTLRSWVTDWSKLGLRTDFVERQEATPTQASGGLAVDVYGNPVDRGAAEVRVIDESYGAVRGPGPKVAVRSTTNGSVLELDADQAAALVHSGAVEYIDQEAAAA